MSSTRAVKILAAALTAAGAAAAWAPASAQVGGQYWIRWSNLDGAARSASGGAYRIDGTLGQPDDGTHTGGAYTLHGGFWLPALNSTVEVGEDEPVPKAAVLRAPAPSPFRDQAVVAFELPAARRVSLVVHSVSGRLVRKLLDGERGAGRHRVHWNGLDDDGRAVPSGIYFVRFTAGDYAATQRLVRLD